MSNEFTGIWGGASGQDYLYHAYALEASVPSRMGNYIYAKKNHENLWVPIYMGEGDLSVCCTDPAVLECIKARGATHLHMRLNRWEADRRFELRDLLDRYLNAFEPDGCHTDRDRGQTPDPR